MCFLVAVTFVSIEVSSQFQNQEWINFHQRQYIIHSINIIKQLKHSDATLVDLPNYVKNKLEEMQAEEKLQNEIEDIKAGQKMMQNEIESLPKNGKFSSTWFQVDNDN